MRHIFIAIPFLFASCSNGGHIKFSVRNNTSATIDSAVITGLGKVKIENIKSGATQEVLLEDCDSPTGDGSYVLKVYSKSGNRQHAFGYFTPGGVPKSLYDLEVNENSIDVKEQNIQ